MKLYKVFFDPMYQDYIRIPQRHIYNNRVRLDGLIEVFSGTSEEVDRYFERTECAVTVIPKKSFFNRIIKVTGVVNRGVVMIRVHYSNHVISTPLSAYRETSFVSLPDLLKRKEPTSAKVSSL